MKLVCFLLATVVAVLWTCLQSAKLDDLVHPLDSLITACALHRSELDTIHPCMQLDEVIHPSSQLTTQLQFTPTGLLNPDSTICYMTSVIQSLFAIPPVRRAFIEKARAASDQDVTLISNHESGGLGATVLGYLFHDLEDSVATFRPVFDMLEELLQRDIDYSAHRRVIDILALLRLLDIIHLSQQLDVIHLSQQLDIVHILQHLDIAQLLQQLNIIHHRLRQQGSLRLLQMVDDASLLRLVDSVSRLKHVDAEAPLGTVNVATLLTLINDPSFMTEADFLKLFRKARGSTFLQNVDVSALLQQVDDTAIFQLAVRLSIFRLSHNVASVVRAPTGILKGQQEIFALLQRAKGSTKSLTETVLDHFHRDAAVHPLNSVDLVLEMLHTLHDLTDATVSMASASGRSFVSVEEKRSIVSKLYYDVHDPLPRFDRLSRLVINPVEGPWIIFFNEAVSAFDPSERPRGLEIGGQNDPADFINMVVKLIPFLSRRCFLNFAQMSEVNPYIIVPVSPDVENQSVYASIQQILAEDGDGGAVLVPSLNPNPPILVVSLQRPIVPQFRSTSAHGMEMKQADEAAAYSSSSSAKEEKGVSLKACAAVTTGLCDVQGVASSTFKPIQPAKKTSMEQSQEQSKRMKSDGGASTKRFVNESKFKASDRIMNRDEGEHRKPVQIEKSFELNGVEYVLMSVVLRYSGHYKVAVRTRYRPPVAGSAIDQSKWHLFNDAVVTALDMVHPESLHRVGCRAKMLFYVRRDVMDGTNALPFGISTAPAIAGSADNSSV